MVLAVDIGNTSISLGAYRGSNLQFTAKLAADRMKSPDEYAVLLDGIFRLKGYSLAQVEGAILLSVVPTLTQSVKAALAEFSIDPLIVGSGIKTSLNIRVETPNLLGADIVANTVGAMRMASTPLIVIDLGTATTLTAINEQGELCGCVIAHGLKLSLDAIAEKCALLPEVSLTIPTKLLGTNTADCMISGAVYGGAFMLDGFINRIRKDYALGENLSVIATGGLCELVIPFCENPIIIAPTLTLDGLYRLYALNVKPKSRR